MISDFASARPDSRSTRSTASGALVAKSSAMASPLLFLVPGRVTPGTLPACRVGAVDAAAVVAPTRYPWALDARRPPASQPPLDLPRSLSLPTIARHPEQLGVKIAVVADRTRFGTAEDDGGRA